MTELTTVLDLPGWCDLDKALAIQSLIAGIGKPVAGVEIGVYGGRSLIAAALAVKQSKHGGYIVGIDPYTKCESTAGWSGTENGEWWSCIDHDKYHAVAQQAIIGFDVQGVCGILRAASQSVHNLFGRINYLHIDGNHSAESSLQDVMRWVPKVVRGGVIILDDTNWASVHHAREYVDQHAQLAFHSATWNAYTAC